MPAGLFPPQEGEKFMYLHEKYLLFSFGKKRFYLQRLISSMKDAV